MKINISKQVIKLLLLLLILLIVLFAPLNLYSQIIEGKLKVNSRTQKHILLLKQEESITGRIIFLSKDEVKLKTNDGDIVVLERDAILKIIARKKNPKRQNLGYWSAFKKNNIKIIGGVNSLVTLTKGRYSFLGSNEIDGRVFVPRFQVGIELEHHSKNRFALSFEPLFVMAKHEVKFSSKEEAFVDTNDPLITPKRELLFL